MLGKKFYLHLELAPGVSLGYEKKTAKIFATAFLQRVVYCPRMDVGI